MPETTQRPAPSGAVLRDAAERLLCNATWSPVSGPGVRQEDLNALSDALLAAPPTPPARAPEADPAAGDDDPRRIDALLAEMADPRSAWEDGEGAPLHRAACAYLAERAALVAACETAGRMIREVRDFRTADGELPFCTIDYLAMDAQIAEIDAALAPARPTPS